MATAQSLTFNPPALIHNSNGESLSLTLKNGATGILYQATNQAGPWSQVVPGQTNSQFTIPITAATRATFFIVKATNQPASFVSFFAQTSFWNTPIGANPAIDANSTAMVQASLGNFASQAAFINGPYGVAMAYATATNKVYTVKATMYASGSTSPGGPGVPFPIPAGTQAATASDGHLAVAYTALDGSAYAGKELDFWQAVHNTANDTWTGSTVVIVDLFGWGAACQGAVCTGADAAGFSLLGGVVRPEEIAQGQINHALAIATPYNLSGYTCCPATENDGQKSAPALPEGARIQLDPTFNVDAQSWPQWVKIIAHALQTYGAYNRDTAGVVSVYGITDQNPGVQTWASVGVPVSASLSMLPWSSMRVMQLVQCP